MKNWLALFVAFVASAAVVAVLETSHAPVDRPLTLGELRATVGAVTPPPTSCVLVAGTDCTMPDSNPTCDYCNSSMAKQQVTNCVQIVWKYPFNAVTEVCDTTGAPNGMVCKAFVANCWNKYNCSNGRLQIDVYCSGQSPGLCVSRADSTGFYCRTCLNAGITDFLFVDNDTCVNQ